MLVARNFEKETVEKLSVSLLTTSRNAVNRYTYGSFVLHSQTACYLENLTAVQRMTSCEGESTKPTKIVSVQ